MFHGRKFRTCLFLRFFFLFFLRLGICGGTLLVLSLFDLVYVDPGHALELEPEIDLHHVLESLMWLRNEHVEEEYTQEGTTLLTRKLKT